MLVLTRKTSDAIVIDGQIRIEVLQIQRGSVRLGIVAPKEISVRRGELLARDPSSSRDDSPTCTSSGRSAKVNAPAIVTSVADTKLAEKAATRRIDGTASSSWQAAGVRQVVIGQHPVSAADDPCHSAGDAAVDDLSDRREGHPGESKRVPRSALQLEKGESSVLPTVATRDATLMSTASLSTASLNTASLNTASLNTESLNTESLNTESLAEASRARPLLPASESVGLESHRDDDGLIQRELFRSTSRVDQRTRHEGMRSIPPQRNSVMHDSTPSGSHRRRDLQSFGGGRQAERNLADVSPSNTNKLAAPIPAYRLDDVGERLDEFVSWL